MSPVPVADERVPSDRAVPSEVASGGPGSRDLPSRSTGVTLGTPHPVGTPPGVRGRRGPGRRLLVLAAIGMAALVLAVDPAAWQERLDRVLAGELGPRSSLAWVVLLAVATFASEDLTCVAAGLLAAAGRLDLGVAIVGCAVGILVGDIGLYGLGALGRRFGTLRWLGIPPRRIGRAREWLERRGAAAVLLSRFLPGTRLPTYVAAGLLGMPPARFVGWFTLAVVLWTPVLVGGAAFLGREFVERLGSLQRGLLAAGAVAVVAMAVLRLRDPRVRGRLRGRWERLVQWEFWPPWTVYPPVIAEVLRQAWRFRSPTLFTLANPGIPGGGLVGESKAAILERVEPGSVARFRMLGAGAEERWAGVESFLSAEGLKLPVVLKPDVGERGHGVRIVREAGDGRRWLAARPEPYLVQEYVAGIEVGIFWLRFPDRDRGRIFSVVEKRLPTVAGDGESTVEELILGDPRLRPRFRALLEGRDPDEVPARGERVRLLEVGAHCRGAIFLDGRRFVTPELEATVERIGSSVEGFSFGRFDVRVADEDGLRRGDGLRVIELNGVAAEAAHVYDPRYGIREAWRTLREQWRLAFEVGAAHRDRGLAPETLGAVLGRIRRRAAR